MPQRRAVPTADDVVALLRAIEGYVRAALRHFAGRPKYHGHNTFCNFLIITEYNL
jgi:hypothetical protein